GAWVLYRAPWYFLFYSGDNCCGPEAHYAVMVARSRAATGPFTRLGRPIVEASRRWNAPGHNAIYTDRDGTDWLVYHAIDRRRPHLDDPIAGDRDVRRVLLMDPIRWRGGWPHAPGAPSSPL
ncbi:MAG TPA: family 43 glycosylhydrolase, partial [Kofleriaceae bacterium]|nr:family 43 glycosylhydrolase [Kofleriaceae bacterium]